MVRLDDRQRLLGDQLELATNFASGPLEHELLAGSRGQEPEGRLPAGRGAAAADRHVESGRDRAAAVRFIPALAQQGDSRALVAAPYLVDRVRLSAKLRAFVAARLDVLDYEIRSTPPSAPTPRSALPSASRSRQ